MASVARRVPPTGGMNTENVTATEAMDMTEIEER